MTDLRSRITASRAAVLILVLAAQIALWTVLSSFDLAGGMAWPEFLRALVTRSGAAAVRWHEPYFLTWNNAVEVGGSCAINLILGVGVTFVIVGGGIDLSVGRVIALALVVLVTVTNAAGSLVAGVAACLGAGLAAGLFNGLISVRFAVPSFIVTLGTMMMARGLAMLVAGGKSIGCAVSPPIEVQRFLPIVVALTAAAAGQVLLVKTIFGRHVFAVGGSPEAARLCGIRVGRVQVLTFLLSGLCAGLAGLVYWCRNGLGDPLAGDGYELYAIAAVIVGGTSLAGGRGSVVGTLLGALIMGVLQNGLNILLVQPHWQYIIIGAVLTVTVLVDRLKRAE